MASVAAIHWPAHLHGRLRAARSTAPGSAVPQRSSTWRDTRGYAKRFLKTQRIL